MGNPGWEEINSISHLHKGHKVYKTCSYCSRMGSKVWIIFCKSFRRDDKQVQIIKRDGSCLPAAERPASTKKNWSAIVFHTVCPGAEEQSKKGRKTRFLDHHMLCVSALEAWADQHLTVFYVVIHCYLDKRVSVWLTASSNLTSRICSEK